MLQYQCHLVGRSFFCHLHGGLKSAKIKICCHHYEIYKGKVIIYTEPHWWHGRSCTDLPRQWCCFIMSLINMRFGWPSNQSYNWKKQSCERTEVTQRLFETASPYILDILTVNFKMHLYSKGLAFLLHTTKVTYIVQEKKNHTTLLWSLWVKHLFLFHCGFLTSFQEIICA